MDLPKNESNIEMSCGLTPSMFFKIQETSIHETNNTSQSSVLFRYSMLAYFKHLIIIIIIIIIIIPFYFSPWAVQSSTVPSNPYLQEQLAAHLHLQLPQKDRLLNVTLFPYTRAMGN